MARVSKVAIERVFHWEDYENIRIRFEYELTDQDNPYSVLYDAYTTIENAEKVFALAREVIRFHQHRFRSFLYEVNKRIHRTEADIEDIKKKLEALKQGRIPCGECPSGSIQEYLERRTKELQEKLKDKETRLKYLKELSIEVMRLRNSAYTVLEDAKRLFAERDFQRAQLILRDILTQIEELERKINSA